MTVEIPLNHGHVALIDNEDYVLVTSLAWYAKRGARDTTWYAVSTAIVGRKMMHRLVMNATGGVLVDHRNGNGLDNRRENLRLATRAQNAMNRGRVQVLGAPYKGVTLHRRTGKWQAFITAEGQHEYLGLYETPEDAAIAYDIAAKRLHGEFARVNFPDLVEAAS